MFTTDPKILFTAFLGGIIPSLLWLWFWLREDDDKPEPKSVVAIVFLMGMIGVMCVLPIQKFIQMQYFTNNIELVLWASSEEIIKLLAVAIIIYRTAFSEEPLDWPIYLITAGLGFAALENTLFLIKPLTLGQDAVGLITGQLRYLGSTLLHAVSSAMIGISLAISLHMSGFKKFWHFILGIIFAISLHSVFNFFIIRNNGNDFLKVFGFLWVVTIIIMLLFEKVRRIN